MLTYKNEGFRQEINADQRVETYVVFGSFSACFRPHQTNALVLEEKIKTTLADCFQRKRARQRTISVATIKKYLEVCPN
jgi:hypothetical protein